MGLQQFERRLERLVEGVFARAFRGGLQPVEVGRRLTREMDLRRTVAPRGTITPNRFRVVLSPADHSKFAPIADELIAELVSVARDHARSENYVLLGQITVNLETDPSLPPGTLTVTGDMDRNRGPSDPDRNRGPGDMDRQRGPGDGDRNRGPAVTDRDRGPSDMDRSQSRGAAVVLPDGRRISVGSRPLAM
ncbi:MAG: DUF3662 domain-containing protein, partial [Acidimicrobiales bacterium]